MSPVQELATTHESAKHNNPLYPIRIALPDFNIKPFTISAKESPK
jgi:hypothetical protein